MAPGLTDLGLSSSQHAILYVPESYTPATPIPLVVLLHGAGGSGLAMADGFRAVADEFGFAILATDSWSQTWDVVQGSFGPDVVFLDRALERVFDRLAVKATRIALAGFSDGATYALSLGLTNGELFSRLIAFSPGFVRAGEPQGKPPIFVSHGTRDAVLPIDAASRQIVPALRAAGYDVEYREFDGGHGVPLEIAKEAMAWLLADRPTA